MTCSINKISAAQNSQVSFESRNKKNATEMKDGNNSSKKILLGLAGLATLGITAVILHKTMAAKKAAKELAKFKGLDTLEVADFKKIGKFDKGRAMVDGKGFSGTINTPKASITYCDGYIQKSSLKSGVEKYYNNFEGTRKNADGSITKLVTTKSSGKPNERLFMTTHSDGKREVFKGVGETTKATQIYPKETT